MLKLRELTELVVEALEDVKGIDIRVFDVSDLTAITDRMVIATGRSDRHVKSLAQNVAIRAKESGHPPRGMEGERQGDWALVDLGDVVVHVMQPQARAFYQLEKLWDVHPPAVARES
jgi:ribosome-associated protein